MSLFFFPPAMLTVLASPLGGRQAGGPVLAQKCPDRKGTLFLRKESSRSPGFFLSYFKNEATSPL